MNTFHAGLLTIVLAGSLSALPVFAQETPETGSSKIFKANEQKPKIDYNITISYELGMHCTGFDFSYCCVLPP